MTDELRHLVKHQTADIPLLVEALKAIRDLEDDQLGLARDMARIAIQEHIDRDGEMLQTYPWPNGKDNELEF